MRTALGVVVCSNLMCNEVWRPFTPDGYPRRRPTAADYWLCDDCAATARRARTLHGADDLPLEPDSPRAA